MRLAIAILVVAAAGSACRPPCVQLAEKICQCEKTTSEREQCARRAQDENARASPSPQDEQVCANLVDRCDCNQLATADGKRDCGLARIADGGP